MISTKSLKLVSGTSKKRNPQVAGRYRKISLVLALIMFFEAINPVSLFALTGGPKSPEFSTFTPVSASDMVNLATGDFSYNIPVVEIPGPDGAGYALSLSYNSGVSPEQEASWVGFGWNLNPGAINRNTRGIPDDYNGQQIIEKYNKTRPNYTIGTTGSVSLEAFTKKFKVPEDMVPIGGLSVASTLRYNNYRGYTKTNSFGVSFWGLSANMNVDEVGEKTYSADIDIKKILKNANTLHYRNLLKKHELYKAKENGSYSFDLIQKEQLNRKISQIHKKFKNASTSFGSEYYFFNFQTSDYSPFFNRYEGFSINYTIAALQVNPTPVPIGINIGMTGNFNLQFNQYYNKYNGYGFLYSDLVPTSTEGTLMDYTMEKDGNTDKRDLYLGMPFAQYDYFEVSGEGLNGGFHAYAKQPGYFLPNIGNNKVLNFTAQWELSVGTTVGVGINVGAGFKKEEMKMWEEDRARKFGDEYSFRFSNDMGSIIDYSGNNTEVPYVKLNRSGGFPGTCSASSNDVFSGTNTPTNEETSKIEYILNSNSKYPGVPVNSIIGFRITNESGVNYTYGISVFNQNTTNLSVDVKRGEHLIEKEYYAYRELQLIKNAGKYIITDEALRSEGCNTVLGEIRSTPSAEIFLLTEITGSDYIDLTNNGPTNDDFGSWTKFNYEKQAGLYRYRSPYFGLSFESNSISDDNDDLGSIITGEKEVYYLSSIETKTHIAEFITSERNDGVEAPDLSPTGDPSANSSSINDFTGLMTLKKLDKIILKAKNRLEKPLKTVNFLYNTSNSLVKNLPNNKQKSGGNSGKLTLKKIYFEYEGIHPVKTSPYEFKYSYKPSSQCKIGVEYFDDYDNLTQNIQNPNYNPFLIGAWGVIAPFAKERREYQILLDYQGKMDVTNTDAESDIVDWRSHLSSNEALYDPAAWHLKQISLPSGGEIHIQYEQKDYLTVQDKPAMVMVSLLNDTPKSDNEFSINVKDLGINPDDPDATNEILKLKKAIEDYYLEPQNFKKIYYRFLYALKGEDPKITSPTSEYITGYASISGVDFDPVSKRLKLKLFETSASTGGYTKIPKTACVEFYKYNRNGLFGDGSGVANLFESATKMYANNVQKVYPQTGNTNNIEDFFTSVKSIASEAVKKLGNTPGAKSEYSEDKEKEKLKEVCLDLEPGLSFIKIPTIYAKRGGGARVKRLLIYDKGIEDGSAVVYGNNYRYVLEDGKTCSGVASNEPSTAREENPMVKYLFKKGQNQWDRITTGEDKEQSEGPIGESLLPSAGIIYSRVVIENIHTGRTGTGFTVNEFYTTKDYPYDKYYNEKENSEVKGAAFDKSTIKQETDFLYLPAVVLNLRIKKLWMAQGFRFILNSMNGVQKRITSYGGQYHVPDLTNGYKVDTDGGYLLSQQEYEYFEPGEKVPVWSWIEDHIVEQMIIPGKEEELAAEKKYTKDNLFDFNLGLDFDISASLLVFVSWWPTISIDLKSCYTHAATKIIRYPVILKKVRSYQNGMYSEQENLVFDKATGNPIVTKTTDSYNGIVASDESISNPSYYSFNVPAFWFYTDMGKKSHNNSYKNILSAIAVKINTYGEEAEAMPKVTSITKPETGSEIPLIFNISNVVNISTQTYKQDWSTSWSNVKISDGYNLNSSQNSKLNKVWKPWSSYAYNNNLNDPKNGLFNLSNEEFEMNPGIDKKYESWIKATEITKYSPNGNALEEVNALGIYSCALYDKAFNYVVPSMVAGNAQYEAIYYNSFEGSQNETDNRVKAHSGSKCLQYYSSNNLIDGIYLTENLQHSGARVFVWVHEDNMEGLSATLVNAGLPLSVIEKARVDGWILYHIDLSPLVLSQVALNTLLNISLSRSGGNFSIDDVRFQPLDAQASCFVYDNSLRLIAQFDDQHFGTYFQYNDEGQLVRKIIETERGRKTIQETQYNIPKKF